MAAEIVQVTRSNRIESRFCAPVHLLAVYERGMRQEGETFVEGLPSSTLRDFRRKLVFVPAGHRYRDWQEPRIRTRVAYFYFDPAAFAINADLSVTELPFSPRLFFEDNGLWDVALKLTTSIEGDGSVHRPYVEALGVLMAHELIRLHTGEPDAKPEARGGLAAWQERTVVAYIEDTPRRADLARHARSTSPAESVSFQPRIQAIFRPCRRIAIIPLDASSAPRPCWQSPHSR